MADYDFIRPEENLGKVYDRRIITRLWGYSRKYFKFIGLAFCLSVILSGSEILLPYLTKLGIDDYILVKEKLIDLSMLSPEQRQSIIARHHDRITGVLEDTFLIRESEIDPKDAFVLKQSGGYRPAEDYYRILLVRYSNPDRAAIKSIMDANPGLFRSTSDPGQWIINQTDLQQLPDDQRWIIRRADWRGIAFLSLIYVGLLLVSVAIMYGQLYMMTWIGQKIMFDIRVRLFDHIQRLPLAFFSTQPTGRLVTRVSNDVDALNEMFTSIVVDVFKNIVMLLGIVTVMLILAPRLAFVTLSLLPVVVIITFVFKRWMREAYREVRARLAVINATLSEHLSGVKLIKAFARQKQHFMKFSRINDESYRANMHQLMVQSSFSPFIVFMENLGIGLILYYGGGQVIQNRISLGTLVAFLSYLSMFFGPVRDIAEKFNILQSAMAASERIFQLMDKAPEDLDGTQPAIDSTHPVDVNGDIEFQNVWFAYEDEDWVLQDVSFRIPAGSTVAFVGATGSGKSTIINLLTRFYSPQRGRILMDGMDIREYDRSFLRSHMAIVLQDVFLFAGDIEKNIRLNRTDISHQKIQEASRLVHADTFIDRLPGRYHHAIEEGGTMLSQGQRQLLAFARALAFEPDILILDEATANIDSETEKLIQDALNTLLNERTSVVVAHRLSTIKKSDQIIVMHKGRILETGDHTSLLAQQGLYYRLYQLQYKHQELTA